MSECGAKTRANGSCKNPAGMRTDHLGQGKCYLHGGATPVKHGRYSTINRPRLRELLDAFDADPDPLDLLPEIKLLRALILDYVERYDRFTDALLAWHESYENPEKTPKPKQMLDILSAGKFIGEIGGLADRIQKQRAEGKISLATLDRVTEQMGADMVQAAQDVIPDPDTRAALFAAVERRWNGIQITGRPPAPA